MSDPSPLSPSPTAGPYLAPEPWDPQVRGSLEAMVQRYPAEAGPRPIAAFDFDGTVIHGDVSETLLELLDERDDQGRVASYRSACRVDRYAAYVELVSTLIAGRTEREARALAQWTLSVGGTRGRIGFREPMRELIWAMQRHGWEVWVVTASAEVLVQTAAEQVGIPPDRVLGMRSPTGADGRYLPAVADPVTYRGGKVTALRAATGRDPVFVAGDSEGDQELMIAARHALWIDKGDEALLEHTSERGWWRQRAWPEGRDR